jgi:hypothetical protein
MSVALTTKTKNTPSTMLILQNYISEDLDPHFCETRGNEIEKMGVISALFLLFSPLLISSIEGCIPRTHYDLYNGVKMPRVSFGTAALPRGKAHEDVIQLSLAAGK